MKLEELAASAYVLVSVPCPECGGTGEMFSARPTERAIRLLCWQCEGRGRVEMRESLAELHRDLHRDLHRAEAA